MPETQRRTSIKSGKCRRLFRQQNGLCAICGSQMGWGFTTGPEMATLDHILPRSKGGSGKIANLRAVHRRCNEERGNDTSDVFIVHNGLIALRWNIKELSDV